MKFFKMNRVVILLVAATLVYVSLVYLPQEKTGLPKPVEEGLAYFKGDTIFSNGGQRCINCHSIASIGLSESSGAPDLSKAFLETPYWFDPLPDFEGNESKLKDFLSRPSTGTMRLIWQQNPLTEDEVEVLAELLKYASREG